MRSRPHLRLPHAPLGEAPIASASTSTRQRRYDWHDAPASAPWAASMLPRLRSIFGTDALGERATAFLTSQCVGSSYESYGSHLRSFAAFCTEEGLGDVLDATPTTIIRYLAWLGNRGTVSHVSLQPYLSAINRFFVDHLREPIALGPMVVAAKHGYKNLQVSLEEPSVRLPLPASAAMQFLTFAETLMTCPGLYLAALRATLAVLVNFCFCNRAGTGVKARHGDLAVDSSFITLYKRVVKGRQDGELTTAAQIPCKGVHYRLAALLAAFFVEQHLAFRKASLSPTWLWQLPTDVAPSSWTSHTLTVWIRELCDNVEPPVQAPPGYFYSSHSLRSGAASAANAVGVSLAHIRWLGGWSRNSDVVQDYISPAVQFSSEAFAFFGWLTPSAPARGPGDSSRTLEPGKNESALMFVQD